MNDMLKVVYVQKQISNERRFIFDYHFMNLFRFCDFNSRSQSLLTFDGIIKLEINNNFKLDSIFAKKDPI